MAALRRIGCLLVPSFAAVAAVRAEPALAGRPLAILDETRPGRLVIEASPEARALGVLPGMTEAAAQARPGEVICRERVPAQEAAAQEALLEVALAHSPRVEEAAAGEVYLDAVGLAALFGDEPALARRLAAGTRAVGLPARIGLAGSRVAARLAARRASGLECVPPGTDTVYLRAAPVGLLGLPLEMARRLARWGIRTLGELAALPGPDLFERLGSEGARLQALARGEDPRPLVPWRPPRRFEETRELDWALDNLEPLFGLFEECADRVCARLEAEALAADRFEWSCRLATPAHAPSHTVDGAFVPPVPTREAGAVMAVLRATLAAAPPPAAVTALTLRAQPVCVPASQEPLDGEGRPSPRALAETVARVIALVGAGNLGVPVLLDSHRPEAIRLDPLQAAPSPCPLPPTGGEGKCPSPLPLGGEGKGEGGGDRGVLALRRCRPPLPAQVRLIGGRPVHLRAEGLAGHIVASAGPWRTSGEWWLESRWVSDEWDVELADGTLGRLAHDGSAWVLEGIYD
jgi:protein ImuB